MQADLRARYNLRWSQIVWDNLTPGRQGVLSNLISRTHGIIFKLFTMMKNRAVARDTLHGDNVVEYGLL